ncbi:hypothetical protein CMUS01_04554 [Colletotrichum musicola]|uniref:Uncharacterized protein n=1 Tax=Colletotrichum musicola TaxID=2175873 RepID=A0A8H6KWP9_9PEZI|nr:hypothetical protein CMUS01_04554 [Colletotrichum musicola]
MLNRNRIRKPSGSRERKAAAAGRCCPSCRQIWAVVSLVSSSSATSVSQSSPGTVESRITTPGGLTTSPGKLEPLPLNVTNAFFAFVGDSPSPLTDVFSQSFLRTYLETSVPVRAVVATIGRIRLEFERNGELSAKQAAAASIVAGERPKLNEFLDLLTAPDYHDQHITLLFGILFSYAEAMVARSWLLFQAIIRKLSDKVQEQLKRKRLMPFLYFDRGLLINYSLLAAYYSLISFEDTFLPDVELYDASPFIEMDFKCSQVRINAATLHWYARYVSYFARLHHRATKWVRQARQLLADRGLTGASPVEDLKEAIEVAGMMQAGRDIVDSSAGVIDMMEMLRGGEAEDDEDADGSDFCVLHEALYHFALMGLTRTFWDPTWKLVDEDLPSMHEMPNLEAHAMFVLERLEQRIPHVGLEMFSYTVVLMGVALESRRPENQERTAAVMDNIIGKGFACAQVMLGDMRLIWGMDYATQHDNGIGPSC